MIQVSSLIELESIFLDFFEKKEHKVYTSSDVVCSSESEILFTTAGMFQFRSLFLNSANLENRTAASSQICIRTTDLDEIENGSNRHLSLFKMLGFFSFNAYFMEKAFGLTLDFLKHIDIDIFQIKITYLRGDEETRLQWKKLGILEKQLEAREKTDNFWSSTINGPCGRCTEIYLKKPNEEYIEVCNIVLIDSVLNSDGSITSTGLKNIDCGIGLERLFSILAHKDDVYMIPNFVDFFSEFGGLTIGNKVIFDHLRTAICLFGYGVKPSNKKHGYILRLLLRKVILEIKKNHKKIDYLRFIEKLAVDHIIKRFVENHNLVSAFLAVIHSEAEKLSEYLEIAEKVICSTQSNLVDPKTVFLLHSSYGLPFETLRDLLKLFNKSTDYIKLEELRKLHTEVSKGLKASEVLLPSDVINLATVFLGYEQETCIAKLLKVLKIGDKTYLVFDKTPFFATSGGQAGDKGFITDNNGANCCIIGNTLKIRSCVLHEVYEILVAPIEGMEYELRVNSKIRRATSIHHSSVHVLFHVLKNRYKGRQNGSYLDEKFFRLDFLLLEGNIEINDALYYELENSVNALVKNGSKLQVAYEDTKKAIASGAKFLEDEVYTKTSRVVSFGEVVELCGGTHIESLSEIGYIKLLEIKAIGQGVFRFIGCSGNVSIKRSVQDSLRLARIKNMFSLKADEEYDVILHARFVSLKNEVSSINATLHLSFEEYLRTKILSTKVDKHGIIEIQIPNKLFIKSILLSVIRRFDDMLKEIKCNTLHLICENKHVLFPYGNRSIDEIRKRNSKIDFISERDRIVIFEL